MGLYSTQEWQKARRVHLRASPICVFCQARGLLTPANVVDHIVPHKGDRGLFFDRSNWQSLCKTCHDSAKKREEMGNRQSAFDVRGNPIDVLAHWR